MDTAVFVVVAAILAYGWFRFASGRVRSGSPSVAPERRRLDDVAQMRRDRLAEDGLLSRKVDGGELRAPWQAQALLNGTERRVYELLKMRATGLTILAKVKLSDVALPSVKPYTSEWQREYNRAAQKHVDFVLVSDGTWMPTLVVEVDGVEHGGTKQRGRDRTKDSVLASAGIPVLRIDADWGTARMAGEIDGWLSRLDGTQTARPASRGPGLAEPQ